MQMRLNTHGSISSSVLLTAAGTVIAAAVDATEECTAASVGAGSVCTLMSPALVVACQLQRVRLQPLPLPFGLSQRMSQALMHWLRLDAQASSSYPDRSFSHHIPRRYGNPCSKCSGKLLQQ
jgi:hypothetical protein